MSDRIWDIFRAPEQPTLEQEISEALSLVGIGVVNRQSVCGDSRVCERVAGHPGQHRLGPLYWGDL